MREYNTKTPLLILTSGALLSLAHHIQSLWFLGFVALVPLLIALKSAHSQRRAFVLGAATGFIYFATVFGFVFSAHPLTWAGIESGAVSYVLISFAWLLTTLLFASLVGLWAVIVHQITSTSIVKEVILFGALWAGIEWLGAILFSVLWWSPDGLIGPHWTFGALGYAFAEFPLFLSLSSIGGVVLMSFVLVCFNTIISKAIVDREKREATLKFLAIFFLVIGTISFVTFYINNSAKKDASAVRVVALHTDFTPSFFTSADALALKKLRIESLFDTILYQNENPDLILLPEGLGYLRSLTDEGRSVLLERMSGKSPVMILDSYRQNIAGSHAKSVLEFETGEGRAQQYTKQLLLPAVEFIPSLLTVFGNTFLREGWNYAFLERLAYSRGSEITLGLHREMRVGALFCSEVLSAELYRKTVREGANLLTNSASHAYLSDSKNLYQQIVKFSKVRAAENNRYFIQSGNVAPSFLIDNHGRMRMETQHGEDAVLYSNASLLENTTVATRSGEFWGPLFIFISLFSIIRSFVKK